jgi:hypothetical protein
MHCNSSWSCPICIFERCIWALFSDDISVCVTNRSQLAGSDFSRILSFGMEDLCPSFPTSDPTGSKSTLEPYSSGESSSLPSSTTTEDSRQISVSLGSGGGYLGKFLLLN